MQIPERASAASADRQEIPRVGGDLACSPAVPLVAKSLKLPLGSPPFDLSFEELEAVIDAILDRSKL